MPRIRAELPAPLSKRELLLWLADQRETVHNGWTERTSSFAAMARASSQAVGGLSK